MNRMQLPTFHVPSQFPENFRGGKIFQYLEKWQSQLQFILDRGVPIPDFIQRIISNGEIDLFDKELFDPTLPISFNKKKYPDFESLERIYRNPGANYQCYQTLDTNLQNVLLTEMVQKEIIVSVVDEDEIAECTFSPLGSVCQKGKTRLTFHHLMNSRYLKPKLDLFNRLTSSLSLRSMDAAESVDLKSYYYQLPLNAKSSRSCAFWAKYHGEFKAFRFTCLRFWVF